MSAVSFAALIAGVALGASLIIAIGAQNAFVLRQGLARNHTFAVALTCVLCDVTLIAAGAVGFGRLVELFPSAASLAAWGGAAFLVVYGALAFRSALHPRVLTAEDPRTHGMFATTGAAVGTALALSLLNPHVYLDTVVLLGSVAGQYPPAPRTWFALGAMAASTAWFFGLAYGARLLEPLFAKPAAWRVLDGAIAGIMWAIAASLVLGQVR